MNRLKLSALGALLLSTAGVAVASASPGDGPGVQVIHAVRTTEAQTEFDLGPTGNSLGDYQVFTARFDANGRTIGFDGGVCTLVRLPTVYQCVATNSLPEGQVTAQALIDYAKASAPFQFAITGGTGRYRSARGTVTVLFGQSNDQVTFRILTGSPDRD
jgi:hypothetical protein